MPKTETAAEAVEPKAAEILEEAVDVFERKASWLTSSKTKLVLAALTGAALGSVVTYLAVRARLSAKMQEQSAKEIEEVKNHYALINKEGVNLSDLAEQYDSSEDTKAETEKVEEIISQNGYTSYDKVVPVKEDLEAVASRVEDITVTQAIVEATMPRELNVFESEDIDRYFLFEEELQRREDHPDEPFVITKDEFDNNETDFNQATLTYYEGDDVVTDSRDTPVDNHDMVVGAANLLRFGHGSGDPKVVYIRNNNLQLDMELTHSEGKYTQEVLGFDTGDEDSLQHSHRRPVRKFRPYDE